MILKIYQLLTQILSKDSELVFVIHLLKIGINAITVLNWNKIFRRKNKQWVYSTCQNEIMQMEPYGMAYLYNKQKHCKEL